jgi:phospholipid N-methyltransferase
LCIKLKEATGIIRWLFVERGIFATAFRNSEYNKDFSEMLSKEQNDEDPIAIGCDATKADSTNAVWPKNKF